MFLAAVEGEKKKKNPKRLILSDQQRVLQQRRRAHSIVELNEPRGASWAALRRGVIQHTSGSPLHSILFKRLLLLLDQSCPWVLTFHTFPHQHGGTVRVGRARRLSAAGGRTRIMCKPVKSHLVTRPCCRCSAAEIQSEPIGGREEEVGWWGAAPHPSLTPPPPPPPPLFPCQHTQGQQVFPLVILAALKRFYLLIFVLIAISFNK